MKSEIEISKCCQIEVNGKSFQVLNFVPRTNEEFIHLRNTETQEIIGIKNVFINTNKKLVKCIK